MARTPTQAQAAPATALTRTAAALQEAQQALATADACHASARVELGRLEQQRAEQRQQYRKACARSAGQTMVALRQTIADGDELIVAAQIAVAAAFRDRTAAELAEKRAVIAEMTAQEEAAVEELAVLARPTTSRAEWAAGRREHDPEREKAQNALLLRARQLSEQRSTATRQLTDLERRFLAAREAAQQAIETATARVG